MSRLQTAIDQIRAARGYTEGLLDQIDFADWFRQPAEGVTHVAWQVGHLAMAEFRLAGQRIRGQRPEDSGLISEDFLKLFGKGSSPVADPARYPAPAELRGVFDRVHRQTVAELQTLSDDVLDEPSLPEHPMFATKLGALCWTAQHEFLHAGQIGLLRRLQGNAPLR